MEKFTKIKSIPAYIPLMNIDTDKIIPKQFLKTIKRSGLGKSLFYEMRFDEKGNPIKGFILDQEPFNNSKILIAGKNFGCGSSREHAPWALLDFGIKVIVSESFADIFYNNCCKNGLLPLPLSEKIVDQIFSEVSETIGYRLLIELDDQRVTTPGGEQFRFEIDPFRKYCLLNGLDQIGLTMQHSDSIKTFEKRQLATSPWLYPSKSS